MTNSRKRRSAATEGSTPELPEVPAQVLSTQTGWIECSYAGPDQMVIRGTVTGAAYFLRPGNEVTISLEDWPVIQSTGLLQQL